jgi:SAM-dependent methyltransferase
VSFKYLLGDSQTEANRLRAQADLWDPISHALFDRLGIAPGWRVLEIGPGAGSLHLELRRRVSGPIDAVEQSEVFAAGLLEQCRADGYGEGTIWRTALAEAPLPPETYDLIFARWVFLFLPDPLRYVRALARALKPGGLLAIQDYFRDTFLMVPPAPDADWQAFIQADHAFFAASGGDVNIGTRLPGLYESAGLELADLTPTVKYGHPGSAVWQWLTTYFFGVLDEYSEIPPFGKEAAARLARCWRQAETRPTSLLVAPAVLDVVGRKPAVSSPRRSP